MKVLNKQNIFYRSRSRIWFLLNIVFTCMYLGWRLFFTLPVEYGLVSMVVGISLFVVEFLGMLEALVHYFNMNKVKNMVLPEVPENRYPHVDVFIATYNEPTDVLYKTVNGCLHMDYPDKSKVHIYLCDDNRRKEVRELAQRMGVGYFDRPDNRHAKAGNLNNALSKTDSPLIVTFDADMIPRHEFLMRTIPYFVEAEIYNESREEKDHRRMGFVQTPQVFYNPDLFQFNLFSEGRIPNEQDYFYRDIQVSRNKSNSVIYGGSNTILTRQALEDIGGFYTGSITEDYGTGILIQKKKYICIAIDEPLASGLSPTDLKSLVNQRRRWARGVITTNRKMHIWLSPQLSLGQKVNYWASCWYWYAPIKRLIYFISPIIYGVFGYVVVKCTLWEILLFWLPMYISSNISLRMLSRNIRTTKWTSIYETVLFPYLLIPVILESFGITMNTFKVTAKGKATNEKGKNIPYIIPFLLLVVLSIIGIIKCLGNILVSGSMGPIVVLFWLLVNLFTLLMSLFFIAGRDLLRGSERARVYEQCKLYTENGSYWGVTSDISETGVAILLDCPISYKTDETMAIEIWTNRYYSKIMVQVVHVSEQKKQWKYAFRVLDCGEHYNQYLQIIYDRVPTLPQKLDASSGAFEDLKINVLRRVSTPIYQKRTLPRIALMADVTDINGKLWKLKDFNYRYFTLVTDRKPNEIKLLLGDEDKLILHSIFEKSIEETVQLYKVTNFDEIYQNKSQYTSLQDWIMSQVDKEKNELMEVLLELATSLEEDCDLSTSQNQVVDEIFELSKNTEKEKREFDEMDYL